MIHSLSEILKETIKFRFLNPIRYFISLTWLNTRKFFFQLSNTESRIIRLLLISDNKNNVSEQQFSPFYAYRKDLEHKFNLVFNHRLVSDVLNTSTTFIKNYDLIFIQLTFLTPPNEVEKIIEKLYGLKSKEKVSLVYWDGDDDLCIQFSSTFSYLDLYVKRHIFKDLSLYQKQFIGKSNLTDYVARTYGVSFADNIIPCSQSINSIYLGKIFLGWTFGLDDKIRNLYYQYNNKNNQIVKNNDIVCRATIREDWMYYLRKDVTPKLQKMKDKCKIIAPDKKVSQKEYYKELISSKICVSPFGYGEVCYRDFEAVICKCLLIKPDMSHIKTEPNIFIPNVTYVPIKWDFSDLEEKCFYYLENKEEREKIIKEAYNVLSEYYINKRFLRQIDKILKQLGTVSV